MCIIEEPFWDTRTRRPNRNWREENQLDPNRTSYIMLVKYDDGEHTYMLAPQKIKIGDQIISGNKKEIKIGNSMPLEDIPVGTDIHNVEIIYCGGGKIGWSASQTIVVCQEEAHTVLGIESIAFSIVRSLIKFAHFTKAEHLVSGKT